jgi:hypothetical protein
VYSMVSVTNSSIPQYPYTPNQNNSDSTIPMEGRGMPCPCRASINPDPVPSV